MVLNRKKEESNITGPVKLACPWWKIFRIKSRTRSGLEDISRQVAHHDWEHGLYWEEIRVIAFRNHELHGAVLMMVHLLQEMAREGKTDPERVAIIMRKLVGATGRPLS